MKSFIYRELVSQKFAKRINDFYKKVKEYYRNKRNGYGKICLLEKVFIIAEAGVNRNEFLPT